MALPSESIFSSSMPVTRVVDLCDQLRALQSSPALERDPEAVQLLQTVSHTLQYLRGGVRALEHRLYGDFETVPEKALSSVVYEHFNDDPTMIARGLALARDVRLLCFFRAVERSEASEADK